MGAIREAKEVLGVDLEHVKGKIITSGIKQIEFEKIINKIEDV